MKSRTLFLTILCLLFTQLAEGAERVSKFTRSDSNPVAQSGSSRNLRITQSQEYSVQKNVGHNGWADHWHAMVQEADLNTFTVYTTGETDTKVNELNTNISNARDFAVNHANEIVAAAKAEANAATAKAHADSVEFTKLEVEKIVNAFSSSSTAEVAKVFGQLIDSRVAEARAEDTAKIKLLEEMLAKMDERLKKLEQAE